MSDRLHFYMDRTEAMVTLLEKMVRMESPSSSKAHVDFFGQFVADICHQLGADVRMYAYPAAGDVPVAIWNGDAPGKPIMLLSHLDTVWPVGTLETMPWRREGDLVFGPGAVDMKGGIVVALEAIRGLVDRGEMPNRPIWALFNSEEEIGAIHTRPLIVELAAQCGLVLVMEPAADGESLKTWRKGIARYDVKTIGRASHAGNAPEAGINAVIEAAHQAIQIHKLNDLPNGTSVSVTTINGGIASNVIPPEATMYVDVRFLKASEAARIEKAMREIEPVLPGARVEVVGGIDRGPMERNEQMIRTAQQAQAIARKLGMDLPEAGSGGGSDGNFTAAMGIPTLDGMGPGGSGLHAAHEQVIIRTIPRRAAFLAQMLCDWDMERV